MWIFQLMFYSTICKICFHNNILLINSLVSPTLSSLVILLLIKASLQNQFQYGIVKHISKMNNTFAINIILIKYLIFIKFLYRPQPSSLLLFDMFFIFLLKLAICNFISYFRIILTTPNKLWKSTQISIYYILMVRYRLNIKWGF